MSKIAFLFPGQGAQKLGMGKQLAADLPAARELFDRANEALGYDLAEICFEGPEDQLNSTVHSQPALFVSSLAALEQLKLDSPQLIEECSATAGLSLGEYTAMVFAGVMDFETALGVVRERGQAMQDAADAVPSGMVSLLGLELDVIEGLCDECRGEDEVLQIANHLCPGNIVVSGHNAACERIAARAMEAGAMKAIPLAVAGAFHTPLMESAVERLRSALESAQLSKPRVPVISNVDAEAHDSPDEIRELLIRQVVSPVQWEASMRNLLADDVREFHEIGAGKVLRGLMRRIDRKASVDNVFA